MNFILYYYIRLLFTLYLHLLHTYIATNRYNLYKCASSDDENKVENLNNRQDAQAHIYTYGI